MYNLWFSKSFLRNYRFSFVTDDYCLDRTGASYMKFLGINCNFTSRPTCISDAELQLAADFRLDLYRYVTDWQYKLTQFIDGCLIDNCVVWITIDVFELPLQPPSFKLKPLAFYEVYERRRPSAAHRQPTRGAIVAHCANTHLRREARLSTLLPYSHPAIGLISDYRPSIDERRTNEGRIHDTFRRNAGDLPKLQSCICRHHRRTDEQLLLK